MRGLAWRRSHGREELFAGLLTLIAQVVVNIQKTKGNNHNKTCPRKRVFSYKNGELRYGIKRSVKPRLLGPGPGNAGVNHRCPYAPTPNIPAVQPWA